MRWKYVPVPDCRFMQCVSLAQFVSPPLIAIVVARTGRWSDTPFVTVVAALAIKRMARRSAQYA